MKKIFIIITFLIAVNAYSQQKETIVPQLAIKFNPVSLFDLRTTSFQAAFEYKIFPHISAQVEGGYISSDLNGLQYTMLEDFQSAVYQGYKLRAELRFYASAELDQGYTFYMGPEFMKKHVIETTEVDVLRYNESFIQEMPKNEVSDIQAGHWKIGIQYYAKDHWFLFDMYVGTGIRYKKVRYDLPEDATISDNMFRMFPSDNVYLPSMVIGFKLGARII
ncbi:MAG: hypothetical protein C0594_00280 [Marinilabiliales bacterium]|nr:MAG: hypothetical protein C0594_00280 [Marinilabiliales bacterium]